jgi:uncharacterized protein (TIGR02271 family)
MSQEDMTNPTLHRRNDGNPLHVDELGRDEERTLELREERLVANKELRDVGEIIVRTEVETLPSHLEVDAFREEVEVEHEAVGETVNQRQDPWEEGGELIVPVYEEQLVVSKRLVLRERLHVRRIGTTERQVFEDSVRRERLVVEDPQQTRLVHEVYPTDGSARNESESDGETQGGLLTRITSKVLQ